MSPPASSSSSVPRPILRSIDEPFSEEKDPFTASTPLRALERVSSFRCQMFGRIFSTTLDHKHAEGEKVGDNVDVIGSERGPRKNTQIRRSQSVKEWTRSPMKRSSILRSLDADAPSPAKVPAKSPAKPLRVNFKVDPPKDSPSKTTAKLQVNVRVDPPKESPVASSTEAPATGKRAGRFKDQRCCDICRIDGTSTFCLRCRHFCTYL